MTFDEAHKHIARRYLVWPEVAAMTDEDLAGHLAAHQSALRRRILEDEAEFREAFPHPLTG